MADKFWPGGLALGKRVRINRPNQPWLTVVGVAGDVFEETDRMGPYETWYLPYVQNAQSSAAADVVLMVRSVVDPRSVEHQVEENIHRSNKDLALYGTAALDGFYLDTLAGPRSGSILIGALAAFGLLLGSLGIYGTLAFSVAERVREIGIRLALGSGRWQIVSLIMKQDLRLLAAATVVGLGAA
ncbi:MAG TPA: FtsX-like permease family protein [Bryobacteraceae bacterium]|jgi:ABC-type antimicrobial peptide transport system permease subunit